MKDIAEKLNLSRTSVSYVLNGRAKEMKIPAMTVERVTKTATQMGYTMNAVAKSITTNSSNVIGFIMSNEYDVGFILEIVNEFCRSSLEKGYITSVLTYKDTNGFKYAVRKCLEQRMAGIVALENNAKEYAYITEKLKAFKAPSVFIHSRPEEIESGIFVYTDDYKGGRMIADHLLKLGHTKIAYVDSDNDHHNTTLRLQGFIDRLAEEGLELDEKYLWRIFTEDMILDEKGTKMLTDPELRPTVVACGSDTSALEILQQAYALGIKVPDELSVSGFADMHFSRKMPVPITTIRQDFKKVGTLAFNLLKNEISLKKAGKNFGKSSTCKIPVELIVRESTAPPQR